jgi:hypothetical protein
VVDTVEVEPASSSSLPDRNPIAAVVSPVDPEPLVTVYIES